MPVKVTVAPLFITIQPQSQTTLVGSMMALIVGATGQRPFSYQWQFNGSDIPGATDDAFLLAAAKISDSGIYSVIVSNSAGAVRSADAVVSINDHRSEVH